MKKIVNDILSRGYKLEEYSIQRRGFSPLMHIVKLTSANQGTYIVSCPRDDSEGIKFKPKGYKRNFNQDKYIKKHNVNIEFESLPINCRFNFTDSTL